MFYLNVVDANGKFIHVKSPGVISRRELEAKIYICGEYILRNGQVIKQSTICNNS